MNDSEKFTNCYDTTRNKIDENGRCVVDGVHRIIGSGCPECPFYLDGTTYCKEAGNRNMMLYLQL